MAEPMTRSFGAHRTSEERRDFRNDVSFHSFIEEANEAESSLPQSLRDGFGWIAGRDDEVASAQFEATRRDADWQLRHALNFERIEK